MSQQVIIEGHLIFRGVADHTANVRGNFSFENQIVWYDDFVGKAIDETNDYTVTNDTGCTATITVPHCLTLTKDTDNEGVNVATGVDLYSRYNAACECRIRIDDVAASLVYFGFVDVQTDQPAATYSGDSLSWTSDDAAIFLYDKDATTEKWFAVSVNGTSTGSVIATGKTPVNAEFVTMRIEFVDNGSTSDAYFYMNTAGQEINPATDFLGIELDAITRTDALCVVVGLEGRDTGSDTVDVDYIKIWQDRY